jgi:hypothetical protein
MQFPVFDQAAPYFKEDLLFPYLYGYNFVSDLYDQGGWDAVNAAYANPPVSTEQIMHPERYPEEKPQKVTIPIKEGVLPGTYEIFDEGDAGEWFTYLYLAHGVDPRYQLDPATAKRAARGWGGGSYMLAIDSQFTEMILVTCNIWDTPEDALEFQKVFTQYGNLRWPDMLVEDSNETKVWIEETEYISIKIDQKRTCWTMAPDQETLNYFSSAAMK